MPLFYSHSRKKKKTQKILVFRKIDYILPKLTND